MALMALILDVFGWLYIGKGDFGCVYMNGLH